MPDVHGMNHSWIKKGKSPSIVFLAGQINTNASSIMELYFIANTVALSIPTSKPPTAFQREFGLGLCQ